MSKRIMFAMRGVIGCILFTMQAAAWATPAAMVSDLQGKVSLHGETPRALDLLDEIKAGEEIEIAKDARLVFVVYATGTEYTVSGEARLRVGTDSVASIGGAVPDVRRSPILAPMEGIRLNPVGLTQAALVTRTTRQASLLKLKTLEDTRTLNPRPEFAWEPLLERDGAYRFELTDDSGISLLKSEVNSPGLTLPANIALSPGVHYSWSVQVLGKDGRKYSNWGDFSVLSDVERADVETRRPAENAPFSEHLLFAVWLEARDLKDEARRVWANLASRRDNPKLHERAR